MDSANRMYGRDPSAIRRLRHTAESTQRAGQPIHAALTDLRHLLGSEASLEGAEIAEILGLLRSIEIHLIARQVRDSIAQPSAAVEPDSWLTPDEVAARLKHTRAWVYRQARHWQFAKRPTRKTLLISERGLAAWMQRR